MTPDHDGRPTVGKSSRLLGVRIGEDITPSAEGLVGPGGGGMSAATGSYWNLPPHRRPIGMGGGSSGAKKDHVYRVLVPLKESALGVLEDLPEQHHALIEPAVVMQFSAYEEALGRTRPEWERVWP